MSIMVEQQEETINAIQETAQTVEKDTEAGYVIVSGILLDTCLQPTAVWATLAQP